MLVNVHLHLPPIGPKKILLISPVKEWTREAPRDEAMHKPQPILTSMMLSLMLIKTLQWTKLVKAVMILLLQSMLEVLGIGKTLTLQLLSYPIGNKGILRKQLTPVIPNLSETKNICQKQQERVSLSPTRQRNFWKKASALPFSLTIPPLLNQSY
jgi:hypothetical protein